MKNLRKFRLKIFCPFCGAVTEGSGSPCQDLQTDSRRIRNITPESQPK